MFLKRILFVCCASVLGFSTQAQSSHTFTYKHTWVDSVYNSLSTKEKIGQLFMVAAYSGGEKQNDLEILKLLKQNQIGGVIFMQGTAEAQVDLTNLYQQSTKVPLLIAMDAEWGLGMRLTGVRDYPKQMMIAATQNPELMTKIGNAIAEQCKLMGVHINFAPCVDINNNPKNPVINFRSFGEEKNQVTTFGLAYMNALQNNGIMACAKHFPGHGDVSVDSHLDLPVINKSKTELAQLELYPFQQLINAGLQSVMIAHLSVPALDNTPNLPSTLSKPIVTDLLQKEMQFDGLIFTDALNMEGVTKFHPSGYVDLKAFIAGNDVLLFSQDVPKAIALFEQAIDDGELTMKRLEHSVKKILTAKYNAGLTEYIPINALDMTAKLNGSTSDIYQVVANQAVTVYKDDLKLLDKLTENTKDLVFVNINGNEKNTSLFKANYPQAEVVTIAAADTAMNIVAPLLKKWKNKTVVFSIHNLNRYPGNKGYYGLSEVQIAILNASSKLNKSVYFVHGTPYIVQQFCDAKTIVIGYEDHLSVQNAMIRVVLNDFEPTGKLPVSICEKK